MKKNLKSKKNNNNKIAIIFSFVIILIVGFLFYNFILKQMILKNHNHRLALILNQPQLKSQIQLLQ